LGASNSNTKFSPYIIAISNANIPYLPGIFNGVITLSVISVANSCTFGSTRTLQALAARGMAPKFFAYVDKAGRPVWCVVLQLIFGLLAYSIDASGDAPATFFSWLLALSGIANFFIWGSICISHVRFRKAWYYHGHTNDELPYQASAGLWGSYFGIFLCVLCLMATFYTAVAPLSAYDFFASYIAAPIILALYLGWKIWTKEWYLLTKLSEIDVSYGVRGNLEELQAAAMQQKKERALKNLPMRIIHTLF
jgi:yeast amino acid transporter